MHKHIGNQHLEKCKQAFQIGNHLTYKQHIRVMSKVRKTQHQNLEFGHHT